MRFIDKGKPANSKYEKHRALILSMRNETPIKTFPMIAYHLVDSRLELSASVSSLKSFSNRNFTDTKPATSKGFMRDHEDYIKALVLNGVGNIKIKELLLVEKQLDIGMATLSAFLRRRNYFKDSSPIAMVHSHVMCRPWTAEGLSGLVAA